MRGTFIVLDGPDGAGTTRQSELLHERIQQEGHTALLTAEPTDGPIGRHIRSILSSTESPAPEAVQLLFCADRAEHIASVVEPALAEGTHVVCDRYALSTIVYGAALGIDQDWLTAVNDHFLTPDITILTLPPPEVCLERLSRRESNDQFENEDLLRKTHSLYSNAVRENVITVDTSGTREESAEAIWQAVAPLLG